MDDGTKAVVDSWDLAKIALGSGVISAILGGAFHWFKEARTGRAERMRQAELDSIHLISKLDILAVQCANNFWSYHNVAGQLKGTDEENATPGCAKPDLEVAAIHLASIDRSIASRIAWLENDVSLGADIIQSRWENYLDSDEAADQYANLVGYFGHQALDISKALRKKYKLRYTGEKWGMPHVENRLAECAKDFQNFVERDD